MHVVVAADQYSLSIGKRGQNVRLTTKLTGWHIEVRKSMATASFEDQKAEAIKDLADTLSVSTAVATQMADAGFLSVEGIVGEDEASFIASTGLDEVTAKGIYAAAQAVAKALLDAEAKAEIPENIRLGSNRQLPSYSQISKVELMDRPFEKTPKMSIKRFLYK